MVKPRPPTTWSIAANQLEPVVIAGLLELKASDLVPLSVFHVKHSLALRKEITELDRQINNLAETIKMIPASSTLAAEIRLLKLRAPNCKRNWPAPRSQKEP